MYHFNFLLGTQICCRFVVGFFSCTAKGIMESKQFLNHFCCFKKKIIGTYQSDHLYALLSVGKEALHERAMYFMLSHWGSFGPTLEIEKKKKLSISKHIVIENRALLIWLSIYLFVYMFVFKGVITILLVPKWSLSCYVFQDVYYGFIFLKYIYTYMCTQIHTHAHTPSFGLSKYCITFHCHYKVTFLHSICKHLFRHSPQHELQANEQDCSSDTLQRYKVGSTVDINYFTDTIEKSLLFEPSTTVSTKSQAE